MTIETKTSANYLEPPTGHSEADWRRWREEREEWRREGESPLAVVDAQWVTTAPTRIPRIDGTWWINENNDPVFELDEGASLELRGEHVTGTTVFAGIIERDSVRFRHNGHVIDVARRGGAILIRPRDPQSEFLKNYAGT